MSWLRIAHRGASGHAPEHTATAFRNAVALSVDMIELDIQLSYDHELVVMHDLTLERTTNGRGAVRDRTLNELKALDCGSWFGPAFSGESILSLSEVIDLLPASVRLNVEIKAFEADWPMVASSLSNLLRSTSRVDSTIVSSFFFGALQELRRIDSEVPIGLLTHDTNLSGIWDWATNLRAFSIHPFYALLDHDRVRQAHQRDLKVITWTANQPEDIGRLVSWGIDGVISDYPECFADLGIDSNT